MNHLSYDIASREISEQLTPRRVAPQPAHERRFRRGTARTLRRLADELDRPGPA